MLVLVAEDEVLIGMMLELDLGQAGYRVAGPASTFAAALQLAARNPPDVALVDLTLNGTPGGIELARALRDRHATTCIILTAQPELAGEARDAALGVIAKPYDPADLARSVGYAGEVRTGASPAAVPRGLTLFR
jgi:DNA-binding response OmpR family regulator